MTDTGQGRTGRPGGSLVRRLLIWYFVTVLAVLIVLSVVLDVTLRGRLDSHLTEDVRRDAAMVAAVLESGTVELPDTFRPQDGGAHLTIVDAGGSVVYDSVGADAGSLGTEVGAALAGTVAAATRRGPGGEELRYVAVPLDEGGAVRYGLPTDAVDAELGSIRAAIVGWAVVAALVGAAAIVWLARSVARPLRRIAGTADEMVRGSDVRAREDGPAEVAGIAASLNALADEVEVRMAMSDAERAMSQSILGAIDIGILLLDGLDRVVYANPAAASLLERPIPADRAVASPTVLRTVREARSVGRASTHSDSGSPVKHLRVDAVAIPTDRVVVVVRDVTEARRVAAMRRDFVADASHELKTPAAAIRSLAETVVRALERDPAGARRFALQIEDQAVRLARIVEDLLDLSRLESGDFEMSRVDLESIVVDEARRLEGVAGERSVRLDVEVRPMTVIGSGKDLAAAVRNLVDNGIRYSEPDGCVRIVLFADGDAAVVEVIDHGRGIAQRDLPRIFERFYRVDVARSREAGGTGLGLAIVKHVAERHGGSVTVDSRLGEGSTFRLVLPRVGTGGRGDGTMPLEDDASRSG